MAFCAYLLQIEFTQIGQEIGEVRVEIHLCPEVKYVIVPVFIKLMHARQLFPKNYILWKSDRRFTSQY
jgi:hypothetical protein